jgi:uncharacterized repeat protein (TIGR02543 family)
MDGARSVTANFSPILYPLDVSVTTDYYYSEGGTVTSSPLGIDCGPFCAHEFSYSTWVTLTATANQGYDFAGWEGACTGTSTTCTIRMDSAKSVTAMFITTFG